MRALENLLIKIRDRCDKNYLRYGCGFWLIGIVITCIATTIILCAEKKAEKKEEEPKAPR